MSSIITSKDDLLGLLYNLNSLIENIRNSKRNISNNFQCLNGEWTDSKYTELKRTIEICLNALDEVVSYLQQAQKTVTMMIKYIDRYENTFFYSNSASNNFSRVSSLQHKGVQSVKEIKKWLKDINPHYYNYSSFSPRGNPYKVNCGSCAFAVESRLSGTNTSAVATAVNIGTDEEMEAATGKNCVYMSVSDIEARLCSLGPGAHLIIGINRKPTPLGRPQSGHWFNAYYDGTTIYTLDGQNGEVYEWPHDYVDVSEWCALV